MLYMNFVLKKIQRHLDPGNTANPIVGEKRNVTTKWSSLETLRPVPKEALQTCLKQGLYWSKYIAYFPLGLLWIMKFF